jgi:hypothetical protein
MEHEWLGGVILMVTSGFLRHIFFPVDLHRRLFDEESRVTWKTSVVAAVALGVEAWVLVMALEYWWWGQIYIKSALLLSASLFIVLTLPGALVTWRPARIMQWHAVILVAPVLAAITSIVLLRFGIIDPASTRYLYRVPGLMVLASCCVAWTLTWKIAGYIKEFKTRKSSILNRWRVIIGILVDVTCIAAYALLLLNIEMVIDALRAIGIII